MNGLAQYPAGKEMATGGIDDPQALSEYYGQAMDLVSDAAHTTLRCRATFADAGVLQGGGKDGSHHAVNCVKIRQSS